LQRKGNRNEKNRVIIFATKRELQQNNFIAHCVRNPAKAKAVAMLLKNHAEKTCKKFRVRF
jgi:hypothetical protein